MSRRRMTAFKLVIVPGVHALLIPAHAPALTEPRGTAGVWLFRGRQRAPELPLCKHPGGRSGAALPLCVLQHGCPSLLLQDCPASDAVECLCLTSCRCDGPWQGWQSLTELTGNDWRPALATSTGNQHATAPHWHSATYQWRGEGSSS